MTNGSLSSYRFSFWLPLFAVILILIPICILSGLIGLAKICGVSILILLIVAMRNWFSLARKKIIGWNVFNLLPTIFLCSNKSLRLLRTGLVPINVF